MEMMCLFISILPFIKAFEVAPNKNVITGFMSLKFYKKAFLISDSLQESLPTITRENK